MNILLVRLRLIGDVVFTTPAIRALRERYPTARLTYVVEPAAAPVVVHNPHLTDVIVTPHLRGWARVREDVRLARRLRAGRYDLAIDFHGGPRSGWLTWASRARKRVGYNIAGRTWMYTDIVDRPPGLQARHSVENQWDLLHAVDAGLAAAANPEDYPVEMVPGEAATAMAARRRSTWRIPDDARIIVLHVSAGNPFRRWPESAFADVVGSLVRQSSDRWVLVTSGPSDQDAARRVVDAGRIAAGDAAPRVVEARDVSLAELRALLDSAALYVGGDSGPLHVAATSRAPIVGLYGPTLAARSAPWRSPRSPTASVDVGTLSCRPCDQRICVTGDYRCLTGLPASTVVAEAERLLETNR